MRPAPTALFLGLLALQPMQALPLNAGTLSEAATAMEAQIAADDIAGAAEGAKALLGQVWDVAGSIGFTAALAVVEPAQGFGIYNPRESEVYQKGEPIYIYAEPWGYGYGAPGEGLFAIGFAVDLKVVDAAGQVLADVPDLTTVDLTSRVMNREFLANITYNLDGIDAGRYVLVTTLRDKYSDKSGSFETRIEIAE